MIVSDHIQPENQFLKAFVDEILEGNESRRSLFVLDASLKGAASFDSEFSLKTTASDSAVGLYRGAGSGDVGPGLAVTDPVSLSASRLRTSGPPGPPLIQHLGPS